MPKKKFVIHSLEVMKIALTKPPGDLDDIKPGEPKNGFGVVLRCNGDENKEIFRPLQNTQLIDEKQIVYGVVYAPDAIDSDGDFVENAAVIEDAAYRFLSNGFGRNIDIMHRGGNIDASVVEQWIKEGPDKVYKDASVPDGSWIVGIKIYDNSVWLKYKSGELGGVSLQGISYGSVVDKGKTEVAVEDKETIISVIHDAIKSCLNTIFNKNKSKEGGDTVSEEVKTEEKEQEPVKQESQKSESETDPIIEAMVQMKATIDGLIQRFSEIEKANEALKSKIEEGFVENEACFKAFGERLNLIEETPMESKAPKDGDQSKDTEKSEGDTRVMFTNLDPRLKG